MSATHVTTPGMMTAALPVDLRFGAWRSSSKWGGDIGVNLEYTHEHSSCVVSYSLPNNLTIHEVDGNDAGGKAANPSSAQDLRLDKIVRIRGYAVQRLRPDADVSAISGNITPNI